MQKSTDLLPVSMMTLASLIPLGIRSLITSRMIRDPMKVYSADEHTKYMKQQQESMQNYTVNTSTIIASELLEYN